MNKQFLKNYSILLFLCNIFFLHSQNSKITFKQDSLISILYATDSLELKSEVHYKLYYLNKGYNPELALKYLFDELELQKIKNDKSKLAVANSQIGWCYIAEVEQPKKAKKYLENSLKLALEINDSTRAGVALTFLGFMNQRTSHFKLAMDYYFKSLKYKWALNEPNRIGFTYNLIGETYNLQEQYEKSLAFHFKALNERKKIPNGHIAHSYQNIGKVYINIKQYDKAINYYNKALKIRLVENNKKHIAICYNGLGNANLNLENLESAIRYFENSKAITDSLKAPYLKSVALKGLAKSYLKLNNFSKAKSYVTQVKIISLNHNYKDHLKDAYKILSDIYFAENNLKSSLIYYKNFVALKDSIINNKTLTQIAELEGIYNTERKEQEILALKQEQDLLKEKERFKSLITYTILAIFGILLLFLWFRNVKRKDIYAQKNEITQLKLENEKNKNKHYISELNQFMQLMISKNTQIKELQHQLDDFPDRKKEEAQFKEKINQLHNTTILTDDDWKAFRSIFEQIHPNFIKNIIKYNSSISSGGLKLATLLKLNLSNPEISSILGISPESVRKNKYRFRKKLKFNTDEKLQDFISNL